MGPVRKQIDRVLETPTQLFAAQHVTGQPRQEEDEMGKGEREIPIAQCRGHGVGMDGWMDGQTNGQTYGH